MIRNVKGQFTGMVGEIEFDEGDLSLCSFKVCIDAASVDTENKKRDDHLRKEDFFDVKRYPEICFESSSVIQNGKNYLTKGTLSLHGQNKEVEIPFTYDGKVFEGNLELSRLDYEVGKKTSKALVGEEVSLEIICNIE